MVPPDDSHVPESGLVELEEVHEQLIQAARVLDAAEPIVGLRQAADELEQAFAHLYEAFDAIRDSMAAVQAMRGHLRATAAVLAPGAQQSAAITFAIQNLEQADRFCEAANERMARAYPRRAEPARLVLASASLPRLHHIDRPRIVPRIDVVEPPPPQVIEAPPDSPPPTSFAELAEQAERRRKRAEARLKAKKSKPEPAEEPEAPLPPEGFSPDPLPALSEAEFTLQRTRECFEEVAGAGIARLPLTGDAWKTSLVIERRMFRAVDAIAAMGPGAVGVVESLVMDTPVRDASRVWAATVVLGCVTGRDALAAAERVFAAVQLAAPEAASTLAEALRFVPNPYVPLVLQRMWASSAAAHRAIAIDVMIHRGLASMDDVARAAVDEPAVASVALPVLALSAHPTTRDAIAKALAQNDPGLRRAAWLAMAYSAHPQTTTTLYPELGGEQVAFAARLLAIAGNANDAARLISMMTSSPTPELIDAVGWAGAPEAVPALIAVMQRGDKKLNVVAGEALTRLTGARLTEEALIDPEDLDVPDVPEPYTGEPPEPLAKQISDPRDEPSDGSPDQIVRPSTSFQRWNTWWNQNRSRFAAGTRYRRGVTYSALVSWNELDRGPCNPDERRWLQRELILRSGGFVSLDPSDLVAQQVQALIDWEPQARAAPSAPGSWSTPRRMHAYAPR